MFADLLNSSYFALFLIVALGFMLGRIKIKGLSLDVSAVIFIALLFGHFGVIIPKELGNFGLVLFIFTIGIQAGPGFFDSFRSKGKTLIVITLLIICSAALTAVGLKYAFDIDTPSVVGLIAGALTSTPGLAVAIDSTHSPLASIAYGIAYPFGVIGVILFVKLLPRIMRIDLDKEARRLEKERRSQFPELTTCLFRVTNPAVFDRSLMQINARAMTGAVISRHKHNEQIAIPTAQTILHEGDYIQAVGSEEALNQLAVLVGQREEGELPLVDMQEIESLLLTKKDMINKQLGDLNLMKNFGCTVTRVRRSGIDLSPSPDLALKLGDKLMVVGEKDGIKGVARLLGNDNKQLSDTDFFPIALGIVLGVLFGKLNISFSDSLSFSPGLTGGILMVALFLSAIGKTGPILWSMSGPANQLLRQLGLLLFLAEVGTSAGRNLVATFQESGWLLFGVGAAITLVPMLVAVIVGLFVFKINILDLLGTITGGMTSTPGLAAADSMTDSNIPSVAYATGYPIAMVASKIAAGYTLDEIENAVTKKTTACFEPTLDYCVLKIPRWPFDKFVKADHTLGTQMKATGEVMAIAPSFEMALLKAVRGAEIGMDTLNRKPDHGDDAPIRERLRRVDDHRLFTVFEALKSGVTVEEIPDITRIDPWFLCKLRKLAAFEASIADGLSAAQYREGKRLG